MMEFFDSYGRGLIVHHWDTDGICSAAMLLSGLKEKEVGNLSPVIGNFYLTDNEIDSIKNKDYEFIAIVDVCFPRENILRLKNKTNSKIFIFDHHLQERMDGVEHINPISRGESPDRFPSTSWVLLQWLGMDLLTVLGAVGDKEERIRDNGAIYGVIDNYLNSKALKFNDLLRMVELIDSSHKIGDKEGVENAVRFVMENRENPEGILNHEEWIHNAEKIKKEIEFNLSKEIIENGNSLILDIDTPFNIISTITRKLFSENPGRAAIVINRGFFPDRDQLYVRGENVQNLIDIARGKGYSAGGKPEVVGVVLPKADTDNFLNTIKENV